MLLAAGASAQQYRTSYFMEGSTMRGYLNPAFRSDRGYIYIPVIGTTSLNFNSNAFALNTIFYPTQDGRLVSILDDAVTWDMIESNLKKQNTIGIDLHTALLGTGFHVGRGFVTLEFGLDVDGGIGLPKSFIEFVKLGSQSSVGMYDMGGFMGGTDICMNMSLGYSHQINDNLTVGARVNFKGGIARVNMNYDKLNVSLNGDRWAVDAAGTVEVCLDGAASQVAVDEQGYIDFDNFDFGSMISGVRGFAGFGMTFDFGAEYILMERIKLSAAILNLGFMNWGAENTVRGVSEASYEFTGLVYDYNPVTGEWDNISGEASFDFSEFAKFRKADGKARSRVYPGFVLGAEYDVFGNNLFGAGAVFTHNRNEYGKRTELALAATVRPTRWFTASLNWTLGNYKNIGDNFFNSFGFALNFHPSWVNFFVGADYLMFKFTPQGIPVNQKVFNVNVGLSIPIGKSHCRGDYD